MYKKLTVNSALQKYAVLLQLGYLISDAGFSEASSAGMSCSTK